MKTCVRAAASLLVLMLCLGAWAETPRQTAEKAYSRFVRLMERKDMAGVNSMLTDGYTMTDAEGVTYNKEAVCQQMASMTKQVRNPRAKIEIAQAERAGDEIVCWVTMHASCDMKVNGKWQRQEFTEKFIETIVHTPDGWKFSSTFVQPR